MPLGDSFLLDLDDPNVTGSLFGGFEPLLGHTSFVATDAPAMEEPSFAQLWAATLTDDGAQLYGEAPHPSTTDSFTAWQEAAQQHQLPAAVELLPPIAPPPVEDEEEVSENPLPTGFFSTENAPLFFVDEQWSPDSFFNPELASQNPFEESVAVLSELSFQNTHQAAARSNLFAPSDGPQQFFPSVAFHTTHFADEASDNVAAYAYPENAMEYAPENAAAYAPENVAAFSEVPPELQNNFWFVDALEEMPQEEIILLEDEVPPGEEEELQEPAVFAKSKSFLPPQIPPVLSASPPSLLTPAIFYDAAESLPPPQHTPPFQTSPLAPAHLQTQGFYEVVLYTMNGTVKRGAFQNADLNQHSVALETKDETEQVPVAQIKAAYFMKPSQGPFSLPPTTGAYWKVVFNDGRRVEGQLSKLQEGSAGFFLVPRQEKSPTAYLYINRSAVQEISSLS